MDTSALFERCGGFSTVRDQLKLRLRGGGHSTSTQVEREWNRIVFETCVSLRQALESGADWTDVIKRLSQGFGRKGVRQLQVLHWITGSKETEFGIVAKRLDDFQRIRHRVMFRQDLGTIRNGTDCDVARRRPRSQHGRWTYRPECKKTDNLCDQPSFLDRNRQRARSAAEALSKSDRKHDREMGGKALAALAAAESAPQATKGKACHAANGLGGDILIALECGEGETLLTMDRSFDLICPAVGVRHERLSPDLPASNAGKDGQG